MTNYEKHRNFRDTVTLGVITTPALLLKEGMCNAKRVKYQHLIDPLQIK